MNNAWPLYLCLQFYLAATMNLLSVVAVMLISQISAAYSTQDIRGLQFHTKNQRTCKFNLSSYAKLDK